MSYSHLYRWSATRDDGLPWPLRQKDEGACLVPFKSLDWPQVVTSYSHGQDKVGIDEWSNLKYGLDTALFHLGSTIATTQAAVDIHEQFPPENLMDNTGENPPEITLLSPQSDEAFDQRRQAEVLVRVTDDHQVDSVTVTYDLNGDGSLDQTEVRPANHVAGDVYSVRLPFLKGALGPRWLQVEAVDSLGNQANIRQEVRVAENQTLSPVIVVFTPASEATFGQASRMVADLFVANGVPWRLMFDGDGDGQTTGANEEVFPRPNGPLWQATWQQIRGPAGVRFLMVEAVNASTGVSTLLTVPINIIQEPYNFEPEITISYPTPQTTAIIDNILPVVARISDTQQIQSVVFEFDLDGDGRTFREPGETVEARPGPDGIFTTRFEKVTGPPGTRTLKITARDASNRVGTAQRTLPIEGAGGDISPPQVRIVSPESNASINLGQELAVILEAEDNRGIDTVITAFDLNGNGTTTDPGETLRLTVPEDGHYLAQFPGVQGSRLERTIEVEVIDDSGLRAKTSRTVRVGDFIPPEVVITAPAEGQAFAPGSELTVSIQADDDQKIGQVLVSFDGDGDGTIDPVTETIEAALTDTGDTYVATTSKIAGPVGVRTLHVEALDTSQNGTSATRQLLVGEPDHSPPVVSILAPSQKAMVPLITDLEVTGKVTDNYSLDRVVVSFDINGNDTTLDPEEVVTPKLDADGHFTATFRSIHGRAEPRTATVQAFDLSQNSASATLAVSLNDEQCGNINIEPISTIVFPSADSDPILAAHLGDQMLFFATHNAYGRELWRTDGTPQGTMLVKDIHVGPDSAVKRLPKFTVIDHILYFVATDAVHGLELWRSDGTSEGTFILKDIYSGPAWAGPTVPVEVDGVLYFAARDEMHGREFWRSDGTPAGTTLVKDINPILESVLKG